MSAPAGDFRVRWQDHLDGSGGRQCLLGCRPSGEAAALLDGLDVVLRLHLTGSPFDAAAIDISIARACVSIAASGDARPDLEIETSWEAALSWLGSDGALFGDHAWRLLRLDAPEQLAWLSAIEGALWLSGIGRTSS